MCTIIDANKLGDFLNPNHEDSEPIRKWMVKGGKLIYSTCGNFAQEVGTRQKNKLAEYLRSGKARLVQCKQFIKEERDLKTCRLLKSDDPHIIALARFTGTCLLYTADSNLIKDFKNRRLLSPRGKIYSRSTNADLLTKNTCK